MRRIKELAVVFGIILALFTLGVVIPCSFDGLSNTILVVEAKDPVPWSKPIDLTYDPDGPLPEFGGHFAIPHRFLHCKYGRRPFFFAGFGDAAIRHIPAKTSERIIRAMITRNGGEQENTEDLEW